MVAVRREVERGAKKTRKNHQRRRGRVCVGAKCMQRYQYRPQELRVEEGGRHHHQSVVYRLLCSKF